MALDETEIAKLSRLVTSKYYRKFTKNFRRILITSRLPVLRTSAPFLGALQLQMMRSVLKLLDVISKANGLLEDPECPEEDKEGIGRTKQQNIELARVYQTIADGIAWRTLEYHRPLIRVMSENTAPGLHHLNDKNQLHAIKSYLLRPGSVQIFNDLTRCLRIGDITRIRKDGKVFIYELKRSGRKLKDMGTILDEMRLHNTLPSRQSQRLLIAQSAFINDKIEVPRLEHGKIVDVMEVDIISLGFPIPHHFRQLKKLIRKANRHGYSFGELENGFLVRITAFDRLLDTDKLEGLAEHHGGFRQKAPEWFKNRKARVLPLSTMDSFIVEDGHYARNIIPYSVFPLSAGDCVRLMMGHLLIESYVSLDILKSRLNDAGWFVDDTKMDLERGGKKARRNTDDSKVMFHGPEEEPHWLLSKRSDGATYYVPLPMTLILVCVSSFYKFDLLLQTVESLYQRAVVERKSGREPSLITVRWVRESDILH